MEPGYEINVATHNPLTVHTYPRVSAMPPFPFASLPPILQLQGVRHEGSVNPYIRSAASLSYTRSLELLRRQLGPHFDLEKLWEMHTYYVSTRNACQSSSSHVHSCTQEFADRNALSMYTLRYSFFPHTFLMVYTQRPCQRWSTMFSAFFMPIPNLTRLGCYALRKSCTHDDWGSRL